MTSFGYLPSCEEFGPRELAPTVGERAARSASQTLPRPRDFESVVDLVTRDAVGGQYACGPDPERHVAAVKPYVDAGFGGVCVQQIGSHHEEFFRTWSEKVLPALR